MPTEFNDMVDALSTGDDVGVQLLRLALFIGSIWVVRWILLRIVLRQTKNTVTIYWFTKISSYVATGLSLLVLAQTAFGGFGSLLTFLGIVLAGLAIALQQPVTNMFAWAFIVARRPYELGHRIQIGDTIGDVVDIRLFQTSLLELNEWVASDQPTGRIVHVPNGRVFTELQYNYTIGVPYIWDELPVLITFESDWQKAKRLLIEIVDRSVPLDERLSNADLRRVGMEFHIGEIQGEPEVFTSVLDSGVALTLRYTVRPELRRSRAQLVWEAILVEFAKHPDIDFAYPTTRFYDNRTEGPMAGRG